MVPQKTRRESHLLVPRSCRRRSRPSSHCCGQKKHYNCFYNQQNVAKYHPFNIAATKTTITTIIAQTTHVASWVSPTLASATSAAALDIYTHCSVSLANKLRFVWLRTGASVLEKRGAFKCPISCTRWPLFLCSSVQGTVDTQSTQRETVYPVAPPTDTLHRHPHQFSTRQLFQCRCDKR
jgi:hypothetical protein